MDVRVGLWRKLSAKELMLLNCGAGEDSWESLGLQGGQTSPFKRRSVLGVHWKDWCWSWNSNTLATSCEELTKWKRPWCWEGLGTGGEGDDRGWDGWMASLTRWTESEWTLGVGDGQGGLACCDWWGCRVGHDWATELNWIIDSECTSVWTLTFLDKYTFLDSLSRNSNLIHLLTLILINYGDYLLALFLYSLTFEILCS